MAHIQRTHEPAVLDFRPGDPPSRQDVTFDFIGFWMWLTVGCLCAGFGGLVFLSLGGWSILARMGGQ